jgi:hypothetical protein
VLSLFLDEDSMDRGLVRGLRSAGVDIVTAGEAGRRGFPDEEQLRFAATLSRTLYTSNVVDFTRLHATWLGAGFHHAGIIVLADQLTDVGTQLRALIRLASTLDLETMRDRLEFLSNWQMRR